jgi:hypothetical protein
MTNKKISALSAATTPLSGTELVPIVQSGNTVNVTVANLTVARNVDTANITATSGGNVGGAGAVVGLAANAGCLPMAAIKGGLVSNATGEDQGELYLQTRPVGAAGQILTTRLRVAAAGDVIVSTGNLGIGISPSPSNLTTIQFGANGITTSISSYSMSNAYFNSGWKYTASSTAATQYQQNAGTHNWFTAPVGTAGNAITFTQGMGLDTSSNLTLNIGNLVQGTAAKGINFTANTPAAGMTSRLLNWYEEGTWTPNQGAGLTVVGAFSSNGTYVRIGRSVTVKGQVLGATTVAVAAAGVISSNLPFTSANGHAGSMYNAAITVGVTIAITSTSATAASAVTATPSLTFTATYQI